MITEKSVEISSGDRLNEEQKSSGETGVCDTQSPRPDQKPVPHLDYVTVRFPWRNAAVQRGLFRQFVAHPSLVTERNKPCVFGAVEKYDHQFRALDGAISGGFAERYEEIKPRGFGKIADKEVQFFVRFSGKYFEQLSSKEQYEFCRQLDVAGAQVTRIDLAVDFPGGCPLTNEDLLKSQINESYYGFRTHSRASSLQADGSEATTFYFGSRTSAKYLRIYKHEGVPRFELELKGDAARFAFAELCSTNPEPDGKRIGDVEGFLARITGYVLGCIKFTVESRNMEAKEDGKKSHAVWIVPHHLSVGQRLFRWESIRSSSWSDIVKSLLP